MAIIRYPDSSEELRSSVLFGIMIRVLVHLKNSRNQQCVVNFRYHNLGISPLLIYPIRRTVYSLLLWVIVHYHGILTCQYLSHLATLLVFHPGIKNGIYSLCNTVTSKMSLLPGPISIITLASYYGLLAVRLLPLAGSTASGETVSSPFFSIVYSSLYISS